MGMDYQYGGSASYPRFDEELTAVANIFGGKLTEHSIKRKETENERPFGYWFGFLSSDDSDEPKFTFPANTNEILVKWFNNPYGDFNFTETKTIWDILKCKHDEIEKVSPQIWRELEYCIECKSPWYIY